MKSFLLLVLACLTLSGCALIDAYYGGHTRAAESSQGKIRQDAYGLGVHSDEYGRPVRVAPAFSGSGGYYGDSRVQREDAYGLGVHMDQYGRAVKTVPAW